jgi:hypothetical protein
MVQLLLSAAALLIERVTAFDGILASDTINMVLQRENSIKKAFMVRSPSVCRRRRPQLILSSGIRKSPTFDQMRACWARDLSRAVCRLKAFSES